ncbi:hypothetical protein ASG31_18010 [Chryseobacterium sp. Leaf404]|uniref:DUF4252 domain-containing protein n=1 Tax=unclassified Chryseobacterium TaxID=2593645 RepID=UPI0006FBCF59|nr:MULTISPECIES: DUF4252 domain-containing protein [unclassified Chryseobacterium]KQT19274.1 hypothetical protein ASG31_18010 [Chryseobacterium sp. Leaf404]
MKNIVLFILLFLGSFTTCTAQNEKIDQLFNDMQKNGVTSIEIKKPMFALLNSIDISDDYLGKIKPIMRDVDGLKLLVFSKITFPDHLKSENRGQIKMNEEKSERVSKLLSDLNLNELMSLKSDDVSMKFLAENARNGILENLIFNVDSKDEIVIFMLNGKMKMDDVNKMISSSENMLTVKNAKKEVSINKNSVYLSGEDRNVGEFSGISASTGVVVNFKQENPTSVKVVADADKMQYIITKVEGGILNIYIDNKDQKNLKIKNISVNVSAPKIEQIKTSSGAIFNSINNINEKRLAIDVSSGSVVNGTLNIKDHAVVEISSGAVINSQINTNEISVKSSSGSTANLKGSAKFGSVDMSSGAVFNAEGFKFDQLKVQSTSGARISTHVLDELYARASSGGVIEYKGNPKIDSDISKISGGSLRKTD